MSESVKVIVRCRPMNTREKDLGCKNVISMDGATGQCAIINPDDEKAPPKSFTFDGAYFIDSTTEQIYADIGYPLVEGVTEGYNGTIFAYGQTGCGKSFSMQGIKDPATQRGIIPRAFDHVFETISVTEGVKFLVHASYLEIYNEEIRDLLGKDAKQKLELKEHPERGVYVVGLSMHPVHNVADCEKVMDKGWKNRSVGATLMNADSSRSHSIFTINIEMGEVNDSGEEHIRAGKLNLVDLAGSERQAKTGATGDRLKEATKINLSLSALGNVISALVDGKSKHIPYRDSKLTRLLQDSLGGNTKTLMVACLSPADNNYDETLSTLRYANRAKNIKNKPKINEDPKDALLREYQEEIERLKAMLMGQMGAIPGAAEALNGSSDAVMLRPRQEPKVIEKVVEKVVTVPDDSAVMAEKEKLKEEYESRLQEMKDIYETEKISKQQLEEDMAKLRDFYDSRISNLGAESKLPRTAQVLGHEPSTYGLSRESPTVTIGEDGTAYGIVEGPGTIPQAAGDGSGEPEASDEQNGEGSTAAISPHLQMTPGVTDRPPAAALSSIAASEAFKRLQELQEQMVGGDARNKQEIIERRKKKKRHAEDRRMQLAQASSKMEDGGIMVGIYDNVQDELRVMRKKFDGEKQKVESLQREITDLQSEFEFDRIDYLDTIRKQEQQAKLLQALLEKIQPCVRRDCNYYNIDRVRLECRWDDVEQRWVLPPLTVDKVALPSTSGVTPLSSGGSMASGSAARGSAYDNRRQQSGGSGSARQLYDSSPPLEEDRFFQKLNSSAEQDAASNYFKPKRQSQLLAGQAEPPPARMSSHQGKATLGYGSANGSMTGVGSNRNGSPSWHGSNGADHDVANGSGGSASDQRAALVHFPPEETLTRKPAKLESLRLPSAKQTSKKKKQQNWTNVDDDY